MQGYINMKNNRSWNSQNPQSLAPSRETWSLARRISRSAFFNRTVTCERYVQVILEQFFPELTEEKSFYGWFQQDSATAHIACMSMQALSDTFRDRNISTAIWQTHSPDINPYDISFCGSLQDKI
jgi:hypothetical protein